MVNSSRTSRWHRGLVILCLGMGLGVGTVFLSVFQVSLLEPLPFPQPDQLVELNRVFQRAGLERTSGLGPTAVDSLRERSSTLKSIAQFSLHEVEAGIRGAARPVIQCAADHSFFDVLGRGPEEGRGFLRDDEIIGAPSVALLRRDLWRTLYGEERLAGQSIEIDGTLHTIIGILPPDFALTKQEALVWVPLRVPVGARANSAYPTIARLEQGKEPVAAEAEIESMFGPDGIEARVTTLRERLVSEIRAPLNALALTALVLMTMMCFNIMNLVVARAESRRRNDAVRCVLGSSRIGILLRHGKEQFLLCALGGILAWGVAQTILVLLRNQLPVEVWRIDHVEVVGDGWWLLAGVTCVLAATTTCVSFIVTLAWSDYQILKTAGPLGLSGDPRSYRARRMLLACEIAIALVLVHSGILLFENFRRISRVDPGFDPHHVQVMTLSFTGPSAGDASHRARLLRLTERIRALPDVEEAGVGTLLPFSIVGLSGMNMKPEGYLPLSGEFPFVNYSVLERRLFGTLGLRWAQGALPATGDARDAIFVNEEFVRRFLSDGVAIGKEVEAGASFHIQGVIRDLKQVALTSPPYAEAYFLLEGQTPPTPFPVMGRRAYLYYRASRDAASDLAAMIEESIPGTQILGSQGLDDRIAESIGVPRFWNAVVGTMAIVGALLAVLGVHAVASFAVTRRVHEFAVRSAVGASPFEISQVVFREVLRSVGPGIVTGLLLIAFSGRLFSGLLYRMTPLDPAVLVAVLAALALVALLGCYSPALKASRVDAIAALRTE